MLKSLILVQMGARMGGMPKWGAVDLSNRKGLCLNNLVEIFIIIIIALYETFFFAFKPLP